MSTRPIGVVSLAVGLHWRAEHVTGRFVLSKRGIISNLGFGQGARSEDENCQLLQGEDEIEMPSLWSFTFKVRSGQTNKSLTIRGNGGDLERLDRCHFRRVEEPHTTMYG